MVSSSWSWSWSWRARRGYPLVVRPGSTPWKLCGPNEDNSALLDLSWPPDLLGTDAQRDAAYGAIIVKVSIHVVPAVGHDQTWIGHEAASIRSDLLEFSAKTGNRKRNKSRQLVGVNEKHLEVGQVS